MSLREREKKKRTFGTSTNSLRIHKRRRIDSTHQLEFFFFSRIVSFEKKLTLDPTYFSSVVIPPYKLFPPPPCPLPPSYSSSLAIP